MKKLKILVLSDQDSGVFFYRLLQPANSLAKQKKIILHHPPFFGQNASHLTNYLEFSDYYKLECKWADVIFTTTPQNREYLALILAMRDIGKCKLVIDIDDDLLATATEPNSPAYKAYQDKNSRFAEYAQLAWREADLLTVSTEYIKKKYNSINPNIVVIKNCIDEEFFKQEYYKPDDITIGFAGSGSHQKDWEMIDPQIKKLKEKYKFKVKMLAPLNSDILDGQIKWAEMLQYPRALGEMGFTIGVAPCKDSLMNRAKSNLRWLEYTAFGIPCVASDVVPFRGIENVLYATEPEDWYNQLEKLIKDENLRTDLGKNAKIEMKTNFVLSQESVKLYERIKSLYI